MHIASSILIGAVIINRIQRSKSDGHIINPIRFPYGGPFMGLFVALALPLELENYNVFVSYNFEANYVLPANETAYDYPPIVTRSISIARKFIYDALEHKLENHGYSGKACLLRAICEAAEATFQEGDVLADILHIILTPSSSKSEVHLIDYEHAESFGKDKRHCRNYREKCPLSLLDLISRLGHIE